MVTFGKFWLLSLSGRRLCYSGYSFGNVWVCFGYSWLSLGYLGYVRLTFYSRSLSSLKSEVCLGLGTWVTQ